MQASTVPSCFAGSCLLLSLAVVLFPILLFAAGQGKEDVPRPARVILNKAAGLINSQAYDQAIDLLTTFQEDCVQTQVTEEGRDRRGCEHAEIHYALGTGYLLHNNYPQAALILEKAVGKDPLHFAAWLNLAKARYEIEEYKGAAAAFIRTYELSPDNTPDYLYYAAIAHLLAGHYTESIVVFERLFAEHPEKIPLSWRENLVHALISGGQGDRSLPHIRILAEQHSGDRQIQWQEILLQQYLQLNMGKEALAYADFLTTQAPTESKWWKSLASIHLQAGDYAPALTALLINGYLQPLSEEELKLVADLYLQLGVPERAAALYEMVMPGKQQEQLLVNLLVALRQLGRNEEALEAIDRFTTDRPSPELLMQKADLLYELGRFESAAGLYRQTAKLGSKQKDRALQMAEYAQLQAK